MINNNRTCYFCKNKHKKMNTFNGRLYCQRHYDHMRLYGYCKKRTIFDKNEIVIYNNYAEVILYDIKFNESGRALIDLNNIEKILKFKWNLGQNGYAMYTVGKKCMHNLIVKTNENEFVDHINRNKLDNRIKNLRVCNYSENSINQNIGTNNKTGVIGISFDNRNNKWIAALKYKNKNINLFKRFKNFNDAVKQRLKWEVKYFKEFAPQKHLFEKYDIKENNNEI